MPTLT
jgi:hypothetical protein